MKKVSTEIAVGKHSIGYVSSGFKDRFYQQSFDAVRVGPRTVTLVHTMTDAQIESELKPGFCTIGDVLAVIMSKKKEYKDGYANLFYTPECVVGVRWISGGWRVFAWDRDGGVWRAGHRVFSRATDQHSVAPASDLTLESLSARLSKLESVFNPELLKLIK